MILGLTPEFEKALLAVWKDRKL